MLVRPAPRGQARAWVRDPGEGKKQREFAAPRVAKRPRDPSVLGDVCARLERAADGATGGVSQGQRLACAAEGAAPGLDACGVPLGQVREGALAAGGAVPH
jgi:hypothetical protein